MTECRKLKKNNIQMIMTEYTDAGIGKIVFPTIGVNQKFTYELTLMRKIYYLEFLETYPHYPSDVLHNMVSFLVFNFKSEMLLQ